MLFQSGGVEENNGIESRSTVVAGLFLIDLVLGREAKIKQERRVGKSNQKGTLICQMKKRMLRVDVALEGRTMPGTEFDQTKDFGVDVKKSTVTANTVSRDGRRRKADFWVGLPCRGASSQLIFALFGRTDGSTE